MQTICSPCAAAQMFRTRGNHSQNYLLPIPPFFLISGYRRWFLDIISVVNIAINIKLALSSIIIG